ncbi:MAG TPA: hypothetical protein VEJ36_02660 [Nitrososphaerales archaeon]|nr:hypothetical protein [Nitrososphaerales archaeon]
MNRSRVGAVLVALVIAVAIFGLLVGDPFGSQKSNSTAQTYSGARVSVQSDILTVGYQAGLWNITILNSGTLPLVKLTVVLSTPVQTEVCSGFQGGIAFRNCPATQGGPYPPGTKLVAYASGAGPGSATIGSSYLVTMDASFANGESLNFTSYVTAEGA